MFISQPSSLPESCEEERKKNLTCDKHEGSPDFENCKMNKFLFSFDYPGFAQEQKIKRRWFLLLTIVLFTFSFLVSVFQIDSQEGLIVCVTVLSFLAIWMGIIFLNLTSEDHCIIYTFENGIYLTFFPKLSDFNKWFLFSEVHSLKQKKNGDLKIRSRKGSLRIPYTLYNEKILEIFNNFKSKGN